MREIAAGHGGGAVGFRGGSSFFRLVPEHTPSSPLLRALYDILRADLGKRVHRRLPAAWRVRRRSGPR
ncbi:hypothetical protein ABT288_08450 [Streptomyces sp. NPDC001093]|uniref:hypothetical protein n=1 Tax=Streptomyces sp. NPDC001093 TaxID=3154376 RepID=UPI0033321617